MTEFEGVDIEQQLARAAYQNEMRADPDAARARLAMLRRPDNFHIYAPTFLRIRTKDGALVPFHLNEGQLMFQRVVLDQLRRKGFVRLIVPKARQVGISTATEGLFYQRTSLFAHQNAFILSHEQRSADNIFAMVQRFHANNPLAPVTGASNAKELMFERLQSSYAVGTMGAKATGRGRSINMLHMSELAFVENAADHFAASVQAVPLSPDTYVIVESSANGASGEFYERCSDAAAGRGDYELFFLPWYVMKEYRRPVPPGYTFELSRERHDGFISEAEYAETFGLDAEQVMWMRAKVIELRSRAMFDQEYPGSLSMAFTMTGSNTLISGHVVAKAMVRTQDADETRAAAAEVPAIIGVDPAGAGGDRFAIAVRRGAAVTRVMYRDKVRPMEGAAWVADVAAEERDVVAINVDAGGIGMATISLLQTQYPHLARIVNSINFGGQSQAKMSRPKMPSYSNRRAEMWDRVLDFLDNGGVLPALPDKSSPAYDDMARLLSALTTDLCSVRIKKTTTNDMLLESKQEMRERGVRSPDLGDAVALTFAILMTHNPSRTATSTGALSSSPGLGVHQTYTTGVKPLAQQSTEVYSAITDQYGWMG